MLILALPHHQNPAIRSTSLTDEINESQVFTIVAATVDPATERIVRFLNEVYGIPINVVFFRHFEDNGVSYIARSWLVEPETQAAAVSTARGTKKFKESWNGRDWYISFGEAEAGRSWEDAEKYGFVSAGGGKWFSRTMKNPRSARGFSYAFRRRAM